MRSTLALALASWLLAACGSPVMPASAAHPLAAQHAPDFKRRALGGAEVDTAALRGKPVVVKFFAKYCEPCKRTLPAIAKLAGARGDVAFVGIAEDESEADVAAVVAEYKLPFRVVHDQGNVLSGRYRVRELPVTFVLDREGTIRWVGGEAQAEGDLAAALDAVR